MGIMSVCTVIKLGPSIEADEGPEMIWWALARILLLVDVEGWTSGAARLY